MSRELPAAVRHFVYSCIGSLEQLEILIRLKDIVGGWTVRETSAAVSGSSESTRVSLEALVARGLLRVRVADPSIYWYEPRSAELVKYVDALVTHYRVDRAAVISLITQAQGPLRNFADAFKLREPKE